MAPQAMSRRLAITIPQSAAANPLPEFRNEINTGMSAPPIRMEKTTPATSANTEEAKKGDKPCPPTPHSGPDGTQDHACREREQNHAARQHNWRLSDLVVQLPGRNHVAREGGGPHHQSQETRDFRRQTQMLGSAHQLHEGDQK